MQFTYTRIIRLDVCEQVMAISRKRTVIRGFDNIKTKYSLTRFRAYLKLSAFKKAVFSHLTRFYCFENLSKVIIFSLSYYLRAYIRFDFNHPRWSDLYKVRRSTYEKHSRLHHSSGNQYDFHALANFTDPWWSIYCCLHI